MILTSGNLIKDPLIALKKLKLNPSVQVALHFGTTPIDNSYSQEASHTIPLSFKLYHSFSKCINQCYYFLKIIILIKYILGKVIHKILIIDKFNNLII